MAIIDYRKSIIHMTLNICIYSKLLFVPNKILVRFCFWQLQKFPNFKRSYLKTSIMTLEYFFHYSLQLIIYLQ